MQTTLEEKTGAEELDWREIDLSAPIERKTAELNYEGLDLHERAQLNKKLRYSSRVYRR